MYAIECIDVHKQFRPEGESPWKRRGPKVPALEGISFSMPQGECFGILGPNGSGKSTLIRLISTLLVADQGEVRVFGHDVRTAPMEVRRLIHRVSVEASFFKKLSAQENLDYASGLYGLERTQARRRAEEILLRLGLPKAKIKAPLEEMSRGQQQKVAIARALLTSPTLLLLDEPTTGLDPRSRRDVQEFIEEIRSSYSASIVLSTHDMQEAQRLCDRVAIIRGGKFIALDTPTALAERYGGGQGLETAFLNLTGEDLSQEEGMEA
ncbi:MAG: ABC transporter ATP-binding protein [Thermaerobacter sp.]|nr:ABC transporter ATP-binding protein [Thermaerobacter sp.]